jgi:hypothetical protein
MMRTATPSIQTFLTLTLLSCVLAISNARTANAQEVRPVEIVNFPEIQNISGKVQIDQPTPHSRLIRRSEILVSPGTLTPGDAVALGVIDASGFTDLVLSVHGLSTDRLLSPGEVTVSLIPDEPPFVKAFEEDGLRLLAIESKASIEPAATNRFIGQQITARLGFPRYRVYLSNTSERSVTVDLYAYLTN